MSSGSVHILPDVVGAGVRSWEAAHAELASAWAAAHGAISALSTPATWGSDSAGQSFAGSYLKDGGPEQVLFGPQSGGSVVTRLGTVGPDVTKAVDMLVARDSAAARAVSSLDGA